MDKRVISINRSNELSETTNEYMTFKNNMKETEKERESFYELHKLNILKYFGAHPDDWDDWKWQMKNRITDMETLKKFIKFDGWEVEPVEKVVEENRFAIVPYYLALITSDLEDPIRKQSVPSMFELINLNLKDDPMNEEYTNPAGSITRRYPDRLIINVTNACAMFCRHCQRRRLIQEEDYYIPLHLIDESIKFIKDNPEIRDVLITGGDAFLLSDSQIDYILTKLRDIDTVEIIRFGTRTLVTMPMRITDNLVSILEKHHPIYVNTHFNHPYELTSETLKATKKLSKAGVSIGNQAVLLRGVNDDKYIMRYLGQKLLTQFVKPYYLFHAKRVSGTGHFVTKLKKGLDIIGHLRGNTSGMAIPTYILNAPGGLGKIPLLPKYIKSYEEGVYEIKTWEGKTIKYKDS